MFTARRLAVIVTLKCTLKCKLCCNCVPMYHNPPILDKDDIKADIKRCFKLFDFIEWFQFVGGELFLHPDMGELIEEALHYQKQFDKLILMTNGTILPKPDAIAALKELGNRVDVQISDYGELSYKLAEMEKLFSENHIPYTTKKYHGDIQHYGGWFDNQSFDYRNYTLEEHNKIFKNCTQIQLKNYHTYNGKLHCCIRSLFAQDLGIANIPNTEYLDLRDKSKSWKEKRYIIKQFGNIPLTACHYCNGFDPKNGKRYPAAEQI